MNGRRRPHTASMAAAPPARVAIVRLSALGDVVHALPVAAALRAAWPSSRLTWIVERRHAAILRGHPALDEVLTVDTRAWRRPRTPGALGAVAADVAALRRRLRAARFDVALDVQGLLKSAVLAWTSGAPIRVGFAASARREPVSAVFANRRVTPPPAARHVVDRSLALLDALGIAAPARPAFHLPRDEAAEAETDRMLAALGMEGDDPIVVLNPGAGRPAKRWPIERFAALAERLVGAGARVLVIWGPGEEQAARAIARAAGVLAPPTDLDGLLAVLRRARVVVAGDTGPLHLAAALGVPTVGLFGPTAAARNGPYGAGHRTLQSSHGTMTAIDTASVLHAVRELLTGDGQSAAAGEPARARTR